MDKDREMIRIDAKPLALDPIIDQVISKMERMLGGRSYLMQYLGHMMAAAGLTKGQAQVLQDLLVALDDLHGLSD